MFSLVHSLKQRILLPLVAVLLVALTLIAIERALSFRKELTMRLRERAEHISSLVHFIGSSAPKPAELQHIVSALGGEPEVKLVVVVAGEPARVVASTRLAMLGKSPDEVIDPEDREELRSAVAASSSAFFFDKRDQEFDYFRPVSVSLNGPGGNELQRGGVLVTLNPHAIQGQVVRATTKAIAGSVGTVLLLAVSCWLLLQRHVLQPVAEIGAAMADFHAGDDRRLIDGTRFSRELAQLAGAWNQLVDRLRREHGKRNSADGALRRTRDELEVRVTERTAELTGANEALQRENTERKRAEETARASEEKFRLLADHITDVFWITSPDLKTMHYISAGYELIWGRSMESLYAHPHQWIETILPEDREAVFAVFGGLMENEPRVSVEYRIARPDGSIRWVHDRGFQVRDAAGGLVRLTGICTDITERRRDEEELRWKSAVLEAQVDSYSVGVLVVDGNGRKILQNRRMNELWKIPQEIAECSDDHAQVQFVLGRIKHPDRFVEKVAHLYAHPDECSVDEIELIDGGIFDRYSAPVMGKDGRHYGRIWTFTDITERKRAEIERADLNKLLVDVSRQAGMAEVATSVLHNVGNVLNSVNVSATLVAESAKKSKIGDLARVVALLDQHTADLGEFVSRDAQGKNLPAFLRQLSEHLTHEQQGVVAEITSLRENIEHIKDIVAMQQSYAKVSGVTEILKITDLIEDSLRMNAGALTRHEVRVVREFQEVPPISVEKHKVLQILVNLIRNAKYACDDAGGLDKRMTLRVVNGGGTVKVSVADNGVGIPAENLTRIFNHGFTTRKDGHGFGLHSGALAAMELGGSLQVHSDGPGRGATFTLELPVETPAP